MVSMIGNSLSGFALSLFVLDFAQSTLLYAVFLFVYTLPQIAAPLLAGPLMDRFSRRKTIYILDFFSAAINIVIAGIVYFKVFNFSVLVIYAFIIGTVNSVYSVAYESFYPLLVTEGNYNKAYSVSSTLSTLSAVVMPIAVILYNSVGIFPLFIINGISFLIAAICETKISDVETVKGLVQVKNYGGRQYMTDMKEGIKYLITDKGLFAIVLYFSIMSLAGGASEVITLPWFKGNFDNGEYTYMFVWVFMVIGRVIGGIINYRVKLPVAKKFSIALIVYIVSSSLEGAYLYTPITIMQTMCFLIGILSATSYNIRISSTQSYVPDERKGRFNGAFLMLNTIGMLIGELTAGLLSEVVPLRLLLTCYMGLCVVAAVFLIGGNRKHVSLIYNREV